ncbi:MAG: ABC transporter permease [Clostridiales bacterium]|nr:ABC transporter permease [Clostridiales bacterium]
MSLKQRPSIWGRLFMGLVFLFLYAPIFVLIVFSFNNSKSRTVWNGFTLNWYVELFRDSQIMNSLYTTLLVALLSAVIATIAGTFASIGFYNMKRRWRDPLMTVNNIPMMNADIVTGVSLCLFFVAAFAGWNGFVKWMETTYRLTAPRLSLGFGTLLIAHISFNIPYVILSVMPKLRQMDKNLIDAAQDLGCTWMQAFWKVVVPEIKPGIINGMLIAFTMSVDDFVISYFTAGAKTSTLAMTIYGMAKRRISPKMNAVSTLLFVTVLILLIIVNVRQAHQEKAMAKQKK